MDEYKQIIAEIEQDLYTAIEALEKEDLVTVRQCSARAQSAVREAWLYIRQGEPQNQ